MPVSRKIIRTIGYTIFRKGVANVSVRFINVSNVSSDG